ncbi:MAG: MbcA/ParS/Xre antitoxin family protein [Acetobacteraceae bacterium]|nr:MbcA/ParS/Xre antitoxin family protein [Acetobacteraceae bacterium]
MLTLSEVATARPSLPDQPITDAEAAAMFRAALNLFLLWGVTDEQAAVLLDVPPRTLARWKAERAPGRLGRDGRARLSNLMGIHKALRIIFREPQRGYAWVMAPNAAFGGRSALAVMLGGELTDLMRVRHYLDAERGAW